MLRGIYSVAGAMESAARNQELAAENLTHAVTPGYRRQGTLFEVNPETNDIASATQNLAHSTNPRSYTNFDSGPLQQTTNPYDLAIVGNAFFIVDGPNGPLYMRNGGFERDATGQLQTRGAGYPVRGNGGPIRVPQNVSQINVASDGTVSANGAIIGQIQVAEFPRTDELRRVGPTLFEGDSPQTPTPGAVRIAQGFREASNVQPVQEMVSMMAGMRQYEAAERALRSLSDAIAQNTRTQQ